MSERSPARARPPLIGLTGGIGAGKSTVAGILEALGCVVARSDEAAREVLREPDVRERLVAWWGPRVLTSGGEIDRSAVASIVFADPDERRRLEALVHPRIALRRDALFASAPRDVPALVIDAPLLYEAGLDAACDVVVFVDASPAVRRERLRASRGWSPAELARREESQLPLDAKRSSADHVIQNDDDLSGLTARVRSILDTIVSGRPM